MASNLDERELWARMFSLWAAIFYLWASSVFFIAVNDNTKYVSSVGYIVGSTFFAITEIIRIPGSSGASRINYSVLFLFDVMLTIGSIFFLPTLNLVVVGNWIFEITSWLISINYIVNWVRMYKRIRKENSQNENGESGNCTLRSCLWESVSRICNQIGAMLFILGNIFLINNAEAYFTLGFVLFTIGSISFLLGASFAIFIGWSQQDNKNSHVELQHSAQIHHTHLQK